MLEQSRGQYKEKNSQKEARKQKDSREDTRTVRGELKKLGQTACRRKAGGRKGKKKGVEKAVLRSRSRSKPEPV